MNSIGELQLLFIGVNIMKKNNEKWRMTEEIVILDAEFLTKAEKSSKETIFNFTWYTKIFINLFLNKAVS